MFYQSQIQNKKKWTRVSLEDAFRAFGSFLSFILRFTNYIIAEFQGFSLDNSMIKKLYSADRDEEETNTKTLSDSNERPRGKKVNRLEESITQRATFSYKYTRLWCILHFGGPWCCCCRVKNKRRDFLYRDAKSKLADETDLLEMIKKIRIFKFASDCTLKPR